MKKISGIQKLISFSLFLLLFVCVAGHPALSASADLPKELADDPITKALSPDIMKAALKEGKVVWYGGTFFKDFKKSIKAFEKRFGIKVEAVAGRLQELSERIKAEHATGNKSCDVATFVDQYNYEFHKLNALEKFKPPAPTLAGFNQKMFHPGYEGFISPLFSSVQSLVLNTDKVKKEAYPKSYWDIIDPKWKGRVTIRDPRNAAGGGWQFLQIYDNPDLGINYIKKLKEVVDPFILGGGSRQMRDAIVTGQFALGFSGRAEYLYDVPKGSPMAYVVPKEGICYTSGSMAIIKGSPHPNAAKVLVTWIYEPKNLQAFADARGRMVPNKYVTLKIPELDVNRYPIMNPISAEHLTNPGFFFDEMEKIFK